MVAIFFVPINNELPGLDATSEGTFFEPTMVMLHSSTQGVSIAYSLDEDPSWKLYTGPIRVTNGRMRIRAISVRPGYKDSDPVEGVFEVTL
ncbi:chitobiase/beta-hexosaminidase C-terminal domain-containing protein [Paenibacillus sp. MBLB4367]|uniref:chitobiase/beta-hexosaminidase C-terminal domain-containing protein n=1 Tax=Paenibacillus sp. MBLB4367 TaxID=3384767 RepID=UPI0039081D67